MLFFGSVLLVLAGAAAFLLWSCLQLAVHFKSADNIFERTRKTKVVQIGTARGNDHRFEFEQAYREGGMGVGSAVWDGSIVLAEFLLEHAGHPGSAFCLKGQRVLEQVVASRADFLPEPQCIK